MTRVNYDLSHGPLPGGHPCGRRFEASLGHALGVYDALKARPEIGPDLVVSHGSFGSSLFLPYLSDCPIVNFFEYFYRPVGQDLGYLPRQTITELDLLRCRADNAMTLLDLENCDRAWTPTQHQRGLMPQEFRPRVEVVHDGIDTRLFRRKDEGGRMKWCMMVSLPLSTRGNPKSEARNSKQARMTEAPRTKTEAGCYRTGPSFPPGRGSSRT